MSAELEDARISTSRGSDVPLSNVNTSALSNTNQMPNLTENIDSDVNPSDEPIPLQDMTQSQLTSVVIGAAAGNFLEWFDFAIFGLLADGMLIVCCF